MPPRASLAAVCLLLSLPLPGRAFDRASALAQLRTAKTQLDPAAVSLRAGSSAQKDLAAAGAALKAMDQTLSIPDPKYKDLLVLKQAVAEAMQAQAQGRAAFLPRLEKVQELLDRLFPAGGTLSGDAPQGMSRPPTDFKMAKSVVDPQKWTTALDGGKSRRFWDLDTASGRTDAGATASKGGGTAIPAKTGGIPTGQQKGLKVAAIPALPQARSPQEAEQERLAAPCRQALAGHPQIASLCRDHPTLAPLIAGVVEAFKAQFGTIQGIATNLMFLVLGLVMSALSGFGLVAKVAVSLVSVAMLAATLGPLIKEGWDASRALWKAQVGTLQQSQSLLRLGQVGGTVLVLALMSAIGYGVGKTKPGRAAIDSMTSALSAQMSRLGLGRGAAALDASLPAAVKAPLERVFGPAAQAEPPSGSGRGELTGAPASINPAETPSNKLALQRQNEAAQILAQNGYRVHQNGLQAGPDYLINGEGHDCYSPFTSRPQNIWDTLSKKSGRNQAHSFVLNLDGSAVEIGPLQAFIVQNPIPKLNEVLVVRGGKVIPLIQAGRSAPLPAK